MLSAPYLLIIIGAGGHARSVADVASRLLDVRDIAFVDPQARAQGQTEQLGYPIYSEIADALATQEDEAAMLHIGIGNSSVRARIATELSAAYPDLEFARIVANSATIGREAQIGAGVFVGEGAHIGTRSRIGAHSIINTHAVVEHDNIIEDYCHISVNTTLAGTVQVGTHTIVGAGATVRDGITITDSTIVGAGAVVVSDISSAGTYIGIPARRYAE